MDAGRGLDEPTRKPGVDEPGSKRDSGEVAAAPISVDRVRHLLKTTRHEGRSEKSRRTGAGADKKARPPIPLFPSGEPDAPRPPRPRLVAAPSSEAAGPGDADGDSPPPDQDTERATPAAASESRADLGRPPPGPPHQQPRREPSWFSMQPEMRWFEPDEPGVDEVEGDDGDEDFEPDDDAPRPRPRSFTEVDRESWFANQPEMQRLIHGEAAGSRRPPERELPDFDEPDRMEARDPHRGVADMLAGRSDWDPSRSAPSAWFTEQPEFRRMSARAAPHQSMGRTVPRWPFVVAAIVVVATIAVVMDPAPLRSLADFVVRTAGTWLVGEPAGDEIRIEPLAERDEAPIEEPAPSEPEPLAKALQSAPAASPGTSPAQSGDRLTVLVKRPAPAAIADTGEPAAPVPPFAPPVAEIGPAQTNGSAGESVFAPSQPAVATPPPGAEPAGDPFASFSAEGGVARQPREAPSPPEAPSSQAPPPLASAAPSIGTLSGNATLSQEEIGAGIEQARTLFLSREFAGAATILRDIVASDPKNLEALRLYGDVLILERRLAPALEVFDALLAIDPTDTRTLLNRSTTLLALERPADAKSVAESVLAGAPDTVVAVSLRSKANAALGDMAQAMSDCDRVGTLTSSKSALEWCRAAAQNHAGNTFVAQRMFISALNSGDAGFVRSKQLYLRDLGLYDGAVDGAPNQGLVDALTRCAVARDCIL